VVPFTDKLKSCSSNLRERITRSSVRKYRQFKFIKKKQSKRVGATSAFSSDLPVFMIENVMDVTRKSVTLSKIFHTLPMLTIQLEPEPTELHCVTASAPPNDAVPAMLL
jgi:hypothetical protein